MSDLETRRAEFAALHRTGCFVIPNPWDIGSAKLFQRLGFKALATTSAGYQFSRGLPDSLDGVSRHEVLGHIAEIVRATDLPVSADFQAGYADSPEGVAQSVTLCVAAGVSGLSIEDATGEAAQPLYDLAQAIARLRAARCALDATGQQVMLTARAESGLVGGSLDDALVRLKAYAQNGADVLFAPGAWTGDDLRRIVDVAGDTPVNAIMSGARGLTVGDLAAIGVRRISVGSALARTGWGAVIRAATAIAEQGRFDAFEDAASFAELNALFEPG